MSNSNNHGHEYYGELANTLAWQDNNERDDQEDLIYAKKKHQDHRGRNKRQARRNINEREALSEMPDEYFDDGVNLL